MHVFAWEALTAGVWPHAPASMLREGRAMLDALVEDLLRIDGCRVTTLRPHDEEAAFERLAAEADVTWLIAPETDGLLADRCRRVEAAGGTLAGPSSVAVELCGDKLKLARFLQTRDVPTIATWPLDPSGISAMLETTGDGPVVVKPRYGAGSDSMRLLPTVRELAKRPGRLQRTGRSLFPELSADFICQSFQVGTAVSVAVIVRPEENAMDVLAVCRQLLADDGTFAYLGGEFPVHTDRAPEIERLIRRVCGVIDGLRGYVGFDLIIPQTADEPVLLVEINPRLTTSYVGYRRLTTGNLAARAIPNGGRVWKIQNCGGAACFEDTSSRRNFEFSTPDPMSPDPISLRFFPDGRCIGASGEL